jgi:hypothetical protein
MLFCWNMCLAFYSGSMLILQTKTNNWFIPLQTANSVSYKIIAGSIPSPFSNIMVSS